MYRTMRCGAILALFWISQLAAADPWPVYRLAQIPEDAEPQRAPEPPPGSEDLPPLGPSLAAPPMMAPMPWAPDHDPVASCRNCPPPPCREWFVYGGGLFLDRDNDPLLRLSFNTADPGGSLLSTRDAQQEWDGGFELGFGRRYEDGSAWEVLYWALFPGNEEATALDPAPAVGVLPDLNTTLNFDTLDFSSGGGIPQSVDNFYDGAQIHVLRRSFEFHNVEMNALGEFSWTRGGRLTSGWLGGVRYLKFDEGFQFLADPNNTIFGDDLANELSYNIDVENNLVGFQLGLYFDYRWADWIRFHALGKAGIFNNDIEHRSRVGNETTIATVNAGPNIGQSFNIVSKTDDAAFIGEADLSVIVHLTPHWSFIFGYRAVALNGVALTADQFARNFNDLTSVATIDSSGALLLHGGYGRLELAW